MSQKDTEDQALNDRNDGFGVELSQSTPRHTLAIDDGEHSTRSNHTPGSSPTHGELNSPDTGAAFVIGQRVRFRSDLKFKALSPKKAIDNKATVAFVGKTRFAIGTWVGIELEECVGKNDGSIKGERYFDCAFGYGLFVRPSQLEPCFDEYPVGIQHEIETPPRPRASSHQSYQSVDTSTRTADDNCDSYSEVSGSASAISLETMERIRGECHEQNNGGPTHSEDGGDADSFGENQSDDANVTENLSDGRNPAMEAKMLKLHKDHLAEMLELLDTETTMISQYEALTEKMASDRESWKKLCDDFYEIKTTQLDLVSKTLEALDESRYE